MRKPSALMFVLMCFVALAQICTTACNHPPPVSSSLAQAAYYGQLESIKNGLEGNADINHRDSNGYTLLMIATYHNHHDIVAYLLEQGADVDLRGRDGRTALILATCNMNTRIIKTLLDYHPDINIKDNEGSTAIDHANILQLQTISNILSAYGAE